MNVLTTIEKLKQNPPKDFESRREYITKCRENRMSYREIGEVLGVSPQRVWHIETGYYSPKKEA